MYVCMYVCLLSKEAIDLTELTRQTGHLEGLTLRRLLVNTLLG